MTGLTPPIADMIAQLVVRHMASTGACIIDLPSAAPALDMCSSIEIRVQEQDVIARHPDSICITPSRPAPAPAPAPVPVEQKPPQVKHPPHAHPPSHPPAHPGHDGHRSPWWTTNWPREPGSEDHGGGGGGRGHHRWMPPEHDCPEDDLPPPATVPEKEEPPAHPGPPADGPAPPDHMPLSPPARPEGGGGGPDIPGTPPLPTQRSSFSPPRPSKTEPPGIVKISSSSPPLVPASTLSSTPSITPSNTPSPPPSPSPSPSNTSPLPAPERPEQPPAPDPPAVSSPPPPPPPPPPSAPPPPPPAPAPAPGSCESTYTTIDVSEIAGVNPHSYGQYLSLLGHHHGSSYHRWGFPPDDDDDDEPLGAGPLGAGATARGGGREKETKKGLVHQYRVRCGVELPSGPAPTFPGFEEGGQQQQEEERGRIVTGGRRECLETCEREAIARAELGSLSECLGVAYRELGLDRDGPGPGRGECRFWHGDGREHEFLPVHELPSARGEGDRWQVLYM
ncbi:hypothetical protein F5B17DRAFT_399081 [Nemania serpens]|nr:hypothetical protein F5B17DRAFT_399081 [Nemania serpens]